MQNETFQMPNLHPLRLPDFLVELEVENYVRAIVGTVGCAEFIGLQKDFKTSEPLVLVRHRRLPGTAVAVRFGQVNELSVTLAVAAQFRRYFK